MHERVKKNTIKKLGSAHAARVRKRRLTAAQSRELISSLASSVKLPYKPKSFTVRELREAVADIMNKSE